MSETAWGFFEGSYHVKALDRERPGDGDGLELLCRQMGLPSVELASFIPVDDLLCVSLHGGLVKTLMKGFFDQRPWGRMISVDSGMDLVEELFPLVGRDALHEYPRWTSFVEFVTERDEGLGVSSDPSCFSSFGWKNHFEEIGE